jgi:NTP pyrophosphatase (non-canonical NTP hydrolase)
MKVNMKGFIRNLVGSVLNTLADEGHIFNEHGEPIDSDDLEYSEIPQIAEIITENHLDMLIEEDQLTINELIKTSHEAAKEKGWWDEPKSFVELVMLIVTEAAEAVEEYRAGHEPNETYYNIVKPKKPEGIPSELADMYIRIADLCGRYKIDLQAMIREKIEYNKSRAYKHGNKRL